MPLTVAGPWGIHTPLPFYPTLCGHPEVSGTMLRAIRVVKRKRLEDHRRPMKNAWAWPIGREPAR